MLKMSVSVLLVIFIMALQNAVALQCYYCDGASCEKSLEEWRRTLCGSVVGPTLEAACLKHVYKDWTTKKEISSRRCVLRTKDEEYKCQVKGEEIKCETCKTDLCNSSTSIRLSFAAVVGIFFAMLAPKFFA